MNRAFLDRSGGGLRLYLQGDLQFDASDEALYHAPLGRAADLAAARRPGRPLRALILGGGDGLAARELLRRPAVESVLLIDRDPEVLALGRGALSALNGGAFDDPRLDAREADARDVLAEARGFDAAIVDLTYPEDEDSAELFSLKRLRQVRRALRPWGVVALNAVSPELTPEAFACIGATLREAGLEPLAYAFDLPSFAREGYGRWGFYFASPRRLSLREAAAAGLASGLRLPASMGRLRVAVHERLELPALLQEAAPIAWKPPFAPLRPSPARALPAAKGSPADGFAAWLAAPRGRKTLNALLRALPADQRRRARRAAHEWSRHAEALFNEADLRRFAEETLSRAHDLPAAWRRELSRLRELADTVDLGAALEVAYRAIAVLMIVLLLANVCFPDNAFAKGFSSHSGGDGDFGMSAETFSYSRTGTTWTPARSYYGYGHRTGVYDSQGKTYPSQRLKFTDPQNGAKTSEDLLALTQDLHALEDSRISYRTGLEGFQAVLEPQALSVLDADGKEIVRLRPPAALVDQVRNRLAAELPAVDLAVAQHKKWLGWIAWAQALPAGRDAFSEMERLETMRRVLGDAAARFSGPAAPAPAGVPAGAQELFPGVMRSGESVYFLQADGSVSERSVQPPLELGAEERFLYAMLKTRQVGRKDATLDKPIEGWRRVYGSQLEPAKPWQAPQASPLGDKWPFPGKK